MSVPAESEAPSGTPEIVTALMESEPSVSVSPVAMEIAMAMSFSPLAASALMIGASATAFICTKNFRKLKSKTPGHPEYDLQYGIETTTGPLGQGIANAVGMAISEKILASQFNTSEEMPINHFTYAFLGDGCLMGFKAWGTDKEAGCTKQ